MDNVLTVTYTVLRASYTITQKANNLQAATRRWRARARNDCSGAGVAPVKVAAAVAATAPAFAVTLLLRRQE